MKYILVTIFSLFISTANAQLSGGNMFPGPGTPAITYTGPGDLGIGSFDAWYSCAKAFTAAFAATLGAVCDVVDTATGLTTCTFHIQASGSVNASECNATACATACKITKAYDQTGNGRDASQATLANMPTVTVNALNNLPGITYSSGTVFLQSGTFTRNQPFTYVGVYNRTAGGAAGAMGDSNGNTWMGSGASGNFALAAVTQVSVAASDTTYHAASGLASGTGNNCALNVDGSDTAGLNCGTNNFGTSGFRIQRGGGTQMTGTIMEAGMIGATTTSGNRNSYSSNAHTRYAF